MREIKFRAWNQITKTMIDLKKVTSFVFNIDTDGLFIPFSGMPIMQFTGLLDKQGTEIYEGDIVQFHMEEKNIHHSKKDIITLVGSVEWNSADTGYYFMTQHPMQPYIQVCWADNIKIIGNIYEHKAHKTIQTGE